jgi:hypothetical protein
MKRARDHNKFSLAGFVMIGLFAIHTCMIAAVNLGLELTHLEQGLWIYGICVPMVLAWAKVQVELITRHY